ncbi:MAG: hypothetical protein JWP87_5589 [Labilithrix sp.]|nr:hypothetical protein [Labilithrix sp.]
MTEVERCVDVCAGGRRERGGDDDVELRVTRAEIAERLSVGDERSVELPDDDPEVAPGVAAEESHLAVVCDDLRDHHAMCLRGGSHFTGRRA